MPNKHRLAKLRTKLLASGKLKEDTNVKSALSYLEKKIQMDNEDIDFDYEKGGKNSDFEEEVDDSNGKSKVKVKNNKKLTKRKINESISVEDTSYDAAKHKSEPSEPKIAIPKKSKKNKYFFLAHPEALNPPQKQVNKQKVSKENKNSIVETKQRNKKEEKNKNDTKQAKEKKEKKTKIKSNKIWAIEECNDSSSENDDNKETEDAGYTLDLADIEKNFIIKKKIKKLEDGTRIEVFEPEIVPIKKSRKDENNLEDEEEAEEAEEDDEINEILESDEEDEIDSKEVSNIEQNDANETKRSTESKKNKDTNKDKMLDQLKSSRFRFLNEMLYTQPSSESFEYFKK
jgi:hypothetical protein